MRLSAHHLTAGKVAGLAIWPTAYWWPRAANPFQVPPGPDQSRVGEAQVGPADVHWTEIGSSVIRRVQRLQCGSYGFTELEPIQRIGHLSEPWVDSHLHAIRPEDGHVGQGAGIVNLVVARRAESSVVVGSLEPRVAAEAREHDVRGRCVAITSADSKEDRPLEESRERRSWLCAVFALGGIGRRGCDERRDHQATRCGQDGQGGSHTVARYSILPAVYGQV